MNEFIYSQILSMVAYTQTFEESCRAAALKDDGIIGPDEEIILDKIRKATQKYRKELAKIQRM